MMRKQVLTFLSIAIAFVGDDSVLAQDRNTVRTPTGFEGQATAGEVIFIDASTIPIRAIELRGPVSSTMPGAGFIPFSFSIEPGDLIATRIVGRWEYYCAQDGKFAASFPMLGSVVDRRDCVGVMRSVDGLEMHWVVDNSFHNGADTIWSRRVRRSELSLLSEPREIGERDMQVRLAIRYIGQSGGQIRFRIEEGGIFTDVAFDLEADGEQEVGIAGMILFVSTANAVRIGYCWLDAADNRPRSACGS